MALIDVLLQIALVVAAGHLLTYGLVVWPCVSAVDGDATGARDASVRDDKPIDARGGVRQRLVGECRRARRNLTAVATTLGALAVVLAINKVVRDVGVELSWLIGLNLTRYIYLLEGQLVAWVQSFATPALTAYFGFVYVFGYTYLLTFPVLAYLRYRDPRPLRVLFLAYILNYGFGLVCYVLIVAYGPRNYMPELVEPLLYTSWPQSQLLVQQVNTNTNVFPSLHTSLSATVALIAHRFRSIYPRWLPIATVLAVSIVVSTMYLGIHWATDVVAGVVVGWASVVFAVRIANGAIADLRQRWRERRRGSASE